MSIIVYLDLQGYNKCLNSINTIIIKLYNMNLCFPRNILMKLKSIGTLAHSNSWIYFSVQYSPPWIASAPRQFSLESEKQDIKTPASWYPFSSIYWWPISSDIAIISFPCLLRESRQPSIRSAVSFLHYWQKSRSSSSLAVRSRIMKDPFGILKT